ncbi:hypothetical protein Ddc_07336 [Ditylenchus destructor]|nr:hypothetical protein Ddc_07336 [Ditylenchus destructor]
MTYLLSSKQSDGDAVVEMLAVVVTNVVGVVLEVVVFRSEALSGTAAFSELPLSALYLSTSSSTGSFCRFNR